MNAMIDILIPACRWVLESSLQASVVVLLILAVQGALRRRLPVRWHYGLWLVLILRLLAPVAPESPFSVFNALERGWEWATTETNTEVTVVTENMTLTEWMLPSIVVYEPMPTYLPAAQAPYWTTRHLVALGWVVGIAVLLLLIFQACLRYTRKVREAALIVDPAVLTLLEDCAQRMGVHAPPVYETLHVTSPVVFGTFRPRLFLPQGLAATLSNESLRYVFLHELAHIKRWDLPMNWLTAILQAVHWFNPLLWYAFHRMRVDREFACDALVLERSQEGEATEYGRTLVGLAERFSYTRSLPGLAGIVEGRSNLKRRILHIAAFRHDTRTWSVLAIVAAALLTVVSLTDAQTKDVPEPVLPTAEAEASAPESSDTPKSEVAKESIEQMLVREVGNMEFEDIHLSEILDILAQSFGMNIRLDERVISPLGSSGQENRGPDWVTDGIVPFVDASQIPLKSVLTMILKPMGLVYEVRPAFLYITSPAMLKKEREALNSGSREGEAAESEPKSTESIEQKLATPCDLEYDNFHLVQILEIINETHKINLAIDWRVVSPPERARSSTRGPDWVTDGMVTAIHLKATPVREALTRLLTPLGLTYEVLPDYVFITSPAMLDKDRERYETRALSKALSLVNYGWGTQSTRQRSGDVNAAAVGEDAPNDHNSGGKRLYRSGGAVYDSYGGRNDTDDEASVSAQPPSIGADASQQEASAESGKRFSIESKVFAVKRRVLRKALPPKTPLPEADEYLVVPAELLVAPMSRAENWQESKQTELLSGPRITIRESQLGLIADFVHLEPPSKIVPDWLMAIDWSEFPAATSAPMVVQTSAIAMAPPPVTGEGIWIGVKVTDTPDGDVLAYWLFCKDGRGSDTPVGVRFPIKDPSPVLISRALSGEFLVTFVDVSAFENDDQSTTAVNPVGAKIVLIPARAGQFGGGSSYDAAPEEAPIVRPNERRDDADAPSDEHGRFSNTLQSLEVHGEIRNRISIRD